MDQNSDAPTTTDWENNGISDPVVPLRLALYGHPDSGGYWERHCHNRVLSLGFVPIGECGEWRSCYYYAEMQIFLVIYVDDFKASGPRANLPGFWTKLGKLVELTDVAPVTTYLGCLHETLDGKAPDGTPVRGLSYNMEKFVESCCDRYEELSKKPIKWRPAWTPFIVVRP